MRKTLALTLAALFAFATAGQALAATRLLETGSTLLYPLMNLWVADYQKGNSGVQITTQGTGSGTGISQAIAGVAQIGASDAYMADGAMQKTPMLNIPLAISAQQVNYNIPGLNNVHLNLSGNVLAGIYLGKIAVLGRCSDQGDQQERQTAAQPDHLDSPRRGLGRHVPLHAVPHQVGARVGERPRIRHDDQLAVGVRARSAQPATPAWCRPAKTRRTRSRTSA